MLGPTSSRLPWTMIMSMTTASSLLLHDVLNKLQTDDAFRASDISERLSGLLIAHFDFLVLLPNAPFQQRSFAATIGSLVSQFISEVQLLVANKYALFLRLIRIING